MSTPRPSGSPAQGSLLWPALLGLGALAVYLATAAPGIYWLDSSELAAAAFGLGIAHPPGHPLASLLGRLTCLLPIGSLAFRVTVACALEAALAVAAAAVLSAALLRRLWPSGESEHPLLHRLAIAVPALTLALSYSLWFQAVRAEVYALNLATLLAAACLVLRWDERGDARALLAAALLLGLALCNHHLLVLLALAPIAVLVLARLRAHGRGARLLLGATLLGALGLSTHLYLPLRAARNPVVSWGSPSTLERFGWTVSARAFHKALDKAARESVGHRAGGAFFALLGGLGPVAALLALGGLYLLCRRREGRAAGLLLVGLTGCNLVSPLLVGFDPLNPDAHGYLAVAVGALAPGLAVIVFALGAMAARLAPRARGTAAAAIGLGALVLPTLQALENAPACDLRRHWAAEEAGRALLLAQPAGAVALTAYFESIFNLWALEALADLRPDVSVVHRHFLTMPGYLPDLRDRLGPCPYALCDPRREPALPWLEAWARTPAHPPLELLDALSRARPLRLELDLDLEGTALAGRLRPEGLLLAYRPGGPPSRDELNRHRRAIAGWERAVADGRPDGETRRALVWTHYLLARFACAQGWRELVALHLGRARTLAPLDRRQLELSRRCAPPGG